MTFDLPTANIDHNLPELSVGELSSSLKATVEKAFQRVRVRGEISGFKRAPSGHLYMTLKDNDAVLDAVCWKGTAARLNTLPNDGAEVIATGRLTTYAGRSKYQIVVESFDLAGEGALLKLLEDRRRRLAAEGLFDSEKKQVIPLIPTVIGLVTSPTGAVIRDILHRLADRFPRRVLVWPVLVQGEGAAAEVAAAIEGFNRFDYHGEIAKPDVLIVARGGGSIEDLWAFNEELVIRAAANSRIPLISAIGHETDNTLIDFAADLRAPTPSAAAEMAVPVRNELLLQVNDKGARLNRSTIRFIETLRISLDGLARVLPDPRHALEERAQRLDDWDERFRNSLRTGLRARRQNLKALTGRLQKPEPRLCQAHERLSGASRRLKRAMGIIFKDSQRSLSHAAGLLETLSFERVLERGFVLISDIDGNSIGSVKKLKLGDEVGVGFADGEALVTVTETSDIARQRLPSKRQRKLL